MNYAIEGDTNVFTLLSVTNHKGVRKTINELSVDYEEILEKKCVLGTLSLYEFEMNFKEGVAIIFLEGDRKGIYTSNVLGMEFVGDLLKIKTSNSIYHLRKEKEIVRKEDKVFLENLN
ncbi:hypothetical protein [Virgibacillus sp. DJP39]|uniref:hypothetical protein n=1 Tax=Virgibacillus sp. DJP39 TaxID=3409790 RepID=UPI003BB782C3